MQNNTIKNGYWWAETKNDGSRQIIEIRTWSDGVQSAWIIGSDGCLDLSYFNLLKPVEPYLSHPPTVEEFKAHGEWCKEFDPENYCEPFPELTPDEIEYYKGFGIKEHQIGKYFSIKEIRRIFGEIEKDMSTGTNMSTGLSEFSDEEIEKLPPIEYGKL
jgi:hypothetical protein